MADTLLRLKVDSKEYDDKLKRATEGIQRYVQKCREVGGTLEHLDDGVLDFVKGLGEMDTVAKTGTQQLREMTKSITDLTIQYRSLTEDASWKSARPCWVLRQQTTSFLPQWYMRLPF